MLTLSRGFPSLLFISQLTVFTCFYFLFEVLSPRSFLFFPPDTCRSVRKGGGMLAGYEPTTSAASHHTFLALLSHFGARLNTTGNQPPYFTPAPFICVFVQLCCLFYKATKFVVFCHILYKHGLDSCIRDICAPINILFRTWTFISSVRGFPISKGPLTKDTATTTITIT